MGIFWAVIAQPILAFITTAISIQTLYISSKSILLKGLPGSSSVQWSEVESISASQAYSVRKTVGIPLPHRLMKIMTIKTNNFTMRILEPPYTSTKKEIINALMKNAPENIKPNIIKIAKEWLSKW